MHAASPVPAQLSLCVVSCFVSKCPRTQEHALTDSRAATGAAPVTQQQRERRGIGQQQQQRERLRQRRMPRAMLLLMLLSAAGAAAAAADYIDITVPVTTGMPSFAHRASGLPLAWRLLTTSLANDGLCNQSFLSMDAHTGTHIDAPCHFLDDGHGIEDLDLSVLIGPALVVRVPDGSNITADMLKSLKLPTEARRVLFKTANTERRLMWRSAFASDYIGLDTSAANHITQETDIALVGIDYLSIARLEDIEEPHKILFRKGVVAVEGLDLSQVEPGWYQQICLPPKLAGSDGAPVRCLLQPLSSGNRPAAAAGRHSSDEL